MRFLKIRLLSLLVVASSLVSGAEWVPCGRQFFVASKGSGRDSLVSVPMLSVTKELVHKVTVSCGMTHEEDWLNMTLLLTSEPQLKNPEVTLYIRFERPGNPSFAMLQHDWDYMWVKVNRQGLVSSQYDRKPEVAIVNDTKKGFEAHVRLPIPKHVNWYRTVNPETDYALFACRVSAQNMRQPRYYFTNHEDRLGASMSKVLFVNKREDVAMAARHFDWIANIRKPWDILQEHLAELEGLGEGEKAAGLESRAMGWKAHFSSLKEEEYGAERFFCFRNLKGLVQEAEHLRRSALKQRGLCFYALPVWEDDRQLNSLEMPSWRSLSVNRLDLTVTPGERTSFGMGVWNDQDLKNLKVVVTPLSRDGGEKLSVVSWYHLVNWYQGGTADVTQSGVVLQPELLLKNPELIQVDHGDRRNILKVHENAYLSRSYPDDSKDLLPLKTAHGQVQHQFWGIMKFPEDASAGMYEGMVSVLSNDKVLAQMPLRVEVLPFKLADSPLTQQLYSVSRWGQQDPAIAELEIANLKEHGLDRVGLFEARGDVVKAVRLMQKHHMNTDSVYLQGDGGYAFHESMTDEQIRNKVEGTVKSLKALGVKKVYFYTPDEAQGERLRRCVRIAEVIRQYGGHTWAAAHRGWYELAGKFLNHVNISGPPVERQLVDKVHADGNLIFCYNNPQGGVERPGIYRKNYGFLLWASGYDGGMTFAWWWPFGPERDVWNEFDHRLWKDHCMVYPTRNGLVNTIQYEGLSQGINDVRYVGTLMEMIARLPENHPGKQEVERYLKSLQKEPLNLEAPEHIRTDIIRLIKKCL